jgi:signal transduction histidine kinase/DNA-binding response OmpR family regulator
MDSRTPIEKDARRLRVLNLAAWIACGYSTFFAASSILNPSPAMANVASVHAVAALAYAMVPLLARIAPLSAAVAGLSFAYVYTFVLTWLIGTGMGTSMYFVTLAGLAFALFGTERILLVAFFGFLAAAVTCTLEALVPYNTGVFDSTWLFSRSFITATATTIAIFMATVYYALRTNERAEEALARDNEIIQEKSRQLEDKTRQLEIANKYKSHLIASASHDLRQPLHALNLFVARLRDEPDPVDRSRLVASIDASMASMNELFESLLDMTKLDAGIVEPSPTKLPVQRLLDRIETTFADAAQRKGFRLRVVENGAWVESDPILLERILLNLVSNAVRYTVRGGVLVGCRRRGGNTLRIDVCDTGPGIPEDQRRSIFGEFYQLARSDAGRREGLGLGLAIVDRLCRLLAHRVEVDSHPGRGSRFSVTVTVAVAAAQARTEIEMPAPASPLADPARGKRIMVIDDDTLVLDGMRGILQGWGCHVETAVSGDAALCRLAEADARPDLIISDSRLGDGETGLDAIARLRAAAGAPIPAFIITGDTAPERLREATAAGFPLLHKPLSPMALRTTLNRLLRAPATSPRSSAACGEVDAARSLRAPRPELERGGRGLPRSVGEDRRCRPLALQDLGRNVDAAGEDPVEGPEQDHALGPPCRPRGSAHDRRRQRFFTQDASHPPG